MKNIQEFPEQCDRCWEEWQNIALPTSYIQAKSILISGVGGSAISGLIAKSLVPESPVPIFTWQDYGLPGFVNKDTLVIAVSYSGNTEETVDCLKKAAEKTEKIITISSGGKIASLSTNYRTPHYKIDYGSQPRAALGYLLTSLLAIFFKLKIVEITEEDFKEALILLKGRQKKIDIGINTSLNDAKILAGKLALKIPVVIGSGTLSQVAYRIKCDFNENAKNASYSEILPEMNHNALVGFEFPKDLRSKIFVVLLQSKFDHLRNKIRQSVVIQILQRQRINYEYIMLEPSPTPLAEVLQVIHFGDFVSYYLAILNNVEPNPVSIIDYLKDKLAEKPME